MLSTENHHLQAALSNIAIGKRHCLPALQDGYLQNWLKPGETREVTFTIKRAQFASLRPNMRYVVSPGTYSVALGPNSAQLMEARFEVPDLKNGRARKAGAHLPSAAVSGKRTKAAASGR
jgi:hypothetical protein